MRRRRNPYTCIEEARRSRGEVLALVLLTVVLGILLGLLGDGLYDALGDGLPESVWGGTPYVCILLVVLLIALWAWLFHGRADSRRACIDLWLPYHFPPSRTATIPEDGAYQPPRYARRAFMRRYQAGSSALEEFLEAYAEARACGQPFQDFIAADHLALAQCLALYVLHHYGDRSLGPEAPYGWWGVDMASRRLSMNDLPPPLRDNPFLRADQRPEDWRLLLPEHVAFQAAESHWVLRHRRYGQATVHWFPQLAVAGRHSRAFQALTTRMRLSDSSQLYVVGIRLEATAHLRWTLLPASEPFQQWATGLLARLEEALDFDYYVATRPDRITRDLEWKIGWVPEGTSIVEMLQAIEGRLEALEMRAAVAALDDQEQDQEEEGESFVV